jgi:hypothetical protein
VPEAGFALPYSITGWKGPSRGLYDAGAEGDLFGAIDDDFGGGVQQSPVTSTPPSSLLQWCYRPQNSPKLTVFTILNARPLDERTAEHHGPIEWDEPSPTSA